MNSKINGLAFFMIMLISTLGSARGMLRCERIFYGFSHIKVKPFVGDKVFKDEMWNEFKGSAEFLKLELNEKDFNISLLSNTGAGGSVFLIKSPSDSFKPYILKIYRSEAAFSNDVRAFEIINKFLKTNKAPFKVPALEVIAPRILRIQYIEGESVEGLDYGVEGSHRSSEFLKHMVERLQASVVWIRKVFTQQYGAHEIFESSNVHFSKDKYINLTLSKQGADTAVKFYLKADNFLVESTTHELWLIDPY